MSPALSVPFDFDLSLPSRERGLKSFLTTAFAVAVLSLPSRERGLKFIYVPYNLDRFSVAPLAGAWIEISCNEHTKIESKSLPSRERGLKCRRLSRV